jgi:hypothetical protein
MKLQLQGQHLRLRIDESEFSALRAGATLENTTALGTCAWRQSVCQADAIGPAVHAAGDHLAIAIPKQLLDAYAARLPCRDGLSMRVQPAAGPALDVVLEVDVRDSIRARGPRRP